MPHAKRAERQSNMPQMSQQTKARAVGGQLALLVFSYKYMILWSITFFLKHISKDLAGNMEFVIHTAMEHTMSSRGLLHLALQGLLRNGHQDRTAL